MNPMFWRDKRVLLTGHTGFKGAWTAAILDGFGAAVTGIGLAPNSDPSLWAQISDALAIDSHISDLRDQAAVARLIAGCSPQIVIHMAAQAQVRQSYRDPAETYSSNVMGMVNVLEALRDQTSLEAILIVTSDKVYRNDDESRPFNEDDHLGGSDPYSASKAACEIVARSYAESFFEPRGVPLATGRGGNVIGGGDWASDRLVPDVCRAAIVKNPVTLRNPQATRPWQHVLTSIDGYLRYAEALHARSGTVPRALNFGPPSGFGTTVAEMAEEVGRALGNGRPWVMSDKPSPPEKRTLSLDCTKSQRSLDWIPPLDGRQAVAWTAEWYAAAATARPIDLVRGQVERYLALSAGFHAAP